MKIKKLFFLSNNQMMITAIEALGREVGGDFFTLSNEEEAFHFIRDIVPEVILVDLSTITADTIGKIESEFCQNIPVVQLVTKGEEGAQRVIEAPLDIANLLSNLDRICGDFNGEG
ncbi:hypothetical protein ABMA70_11515 [Halobacteriovorax sp. XZX-3]|uniref:hypothetical protein n=1 Tax=unclassified Halobacteriovorax TaxID=2639665 RepID=UPI000CD24FA5|nr:hypothetical protein [Halobacteriovorax sp. DA5]POB13962.1 hypothetical protein C0Z22_07840 [Halobacteriovorax sp. DA5]